MKYVSGQIAGPAHFAVTVLKARLLVLSWLLRLCHCVTLWLRYRWATPI